MSNKLRFRALIGLIAVIMIVDGTLLPSGEAVAQITHTVVVKDLIDPYPVEGLDQTIHFHFYFNNQEVDDVVPVETDPGVYEGETFLDAPEYDSWTVEIDPDDDFDFPYLDPNPTAHKSSLTYLFNWIIDDNRP